MYLLPEFQIKSMQIFFSGKIYSIEKYCSIVKFNAYFCKYSPYLELKNILQIMIKISTQQNQLFPPIVISKMLQSELFLKIIKIYLLNRSDRVISIVLACM